MMQTVQLSISDGAYLTAVREALCRSCAWHVESAERPDPSRHCVLVLDDAAFAQLPLPLSNPERIVLITRIETNEVMAQAWDAGIVSVVSAEDPINTVLLAIMAAALRVAKSHGTSATPSVISPNPIAPIGPENRTSSSKRCKIQ